MPHLVELAREHKDVRFATISVWEHKHDSDRPDPIEAVRAFVRREGTWMNTDVGCDSAGGKIAATWLTAGGQDGIPCAFVTDRKGRIAWVGNSFDLGPALTAVLGHRDPNKAVDAENRRQAALEARLKQAASAGDVDAMLRVRRQLPFWCDTDEAFDELARVDPSRALQFASHVADDPRAEMWQCLTLCWRFLDPGGNPGLHTAAGFALAVRLALSGMAHADSSDESKSACLEYLADAYYKSGDGERGATTAESELSLIEHGARKPDRDDVKRLEDLIHRYRTTPYAPPRGVSPAHAVPAKINGG